MDSKRFSVVFIQSVFLLVGFSLAGCQSTEAPGTQAKEPVAIAADNPNLRYSGRSKGIGTEAVAFGYSGARIRLRFEGESIGMWMDDEANENYMMAWIDGKPGKKFQLNDADGYYELANGLKPGPHLLEVVRVTECQFGLNTFKGFQVSGVAAGALDWKAGPNRKIEFIGDSITCGYGVEANDPNQHFTAESENFCLGYSGLTARALGADYLAVSRSGIGMLRNYNGPYDGSENNMPNLYPDTFYMRPDSAKWDASRFVPDVVCINLGTNDFSTDGVNVDKYVSNYIGFASNLLEAYPEAALVVLQGPMDNSEALGEALSRVMDRLRTVAPDRVHFLELSPQGALGFGADYHPNIAQSKVNAAELTAYLSDLMDWN